MSKMQIMDCKNMARQIVRKLKLGGGKRQYNKSISLIRFVAMLMIISCHIMQWLDIELAWWFNVGVQIFLCMSGFLYGGKDVCVGGGATMFLARRFRKILIPYFIVFIPYGILQFFFAREIFAPLAFMRGLFLNAQLTGAGHLWFISTILMCYVLTPLLEAYRNQYVQGRKNFIAFALLSVEIASLFFAAFNDFYIPAWISCYILGYILGINEKEGYIGKRLLLVAFGIVAAIGNGFQIYCEYIVNWTFSGSRLIFDYNHMVLGIFLFLAMKWIFDMANFDGTHCKWLENILFITDTYSYEVYLVHQLLILGPFSMMEITRFTLLNITFILLCVCVLAWIVKCFEKHIWHCLMFNKKAGKQ